jgi:hypothetical protein
LQLHLGLTHLHEELVSGWVSHSTSS